MRLSFPFFVLIWVAGLLGFGALAGFAAVYDRFPADLWLSHRLQGIDSAAFIRALDWAEDLADVPLLLAVWLPGIALLWALGSRWQAFLLLASGAVWPLNSGLKEIVERPRPSPELVEVSAYPSTFSFPSGHAVTAFVIYGLAFYFAGHLRQRPLRLLVRGASLWVVAFTGLERVYTGVHWPSDVLGGFYLGILAVSLVIAVDRRFLRGRSNPRSGRSFVITRS